MIYSKAIVLLLGAALCEAVPQLAEPEVSISTSESSTASSLPEVIQTPPAGEVADPIVEETPAVDVPVATPGLEDENQGEQENTTPPQAGQPDVVVPDQGVEPLQPLPEAPVETPAPTEAPAAVEPPVQEQPVQEQPVQESPVQESPVQESPVQESSAVETPSEQEDLFPPLPPLPGFPVAAQPGGQDGELRPLPAVDDTLPVVTPPPTESVVPEIPEVLVPPADPIASELPVASETPEVPGALPLPPLIGNGTVLVPPPVDVPAPIDVPAPVDVAPVPELPVLSPLPTNGTIIPPAAELPVPGAETPVLPPIAPLPGNGTVLPAPVLDPLPDTPIPSESVVPGAGLAPLEPVAPVESAPPLPGDALPQLPSQSVDPVVPTPGADNALQPLEPSPSVSGEPAQQTAGPGENAGGAEDAEPQPLPDVVGQPEQTAPAPEDGQDSENEDGQENNQGEEESGEGSGEESGEESGSDSGSDSESDSESGSGSGSGSDSDSDSDAESGNGSEEESEGLPGPSEILTVAPPRPTSGSVPTAASNSLTFQTSIVFPSGLLGAVEGPVDGGLSALPTGGTLNADEDSAAGHVYGKSVLTAAVAAVAGLVVTFVL